MADLGKYLNKFTANSQDWSKIGKDISDDLRKEITTRQETKATIDKQTSDAINEVNKVQLGQNKTFNQFLLNGSGQTKQFLLMQERLLKQGLLKPQDYLNSRQIVSDDWKNLSEAAKAFNEDYADAMTRIQEGVAAGQDMYQNKKYDAFMNIQDKNIFINPVDGRMYLTTVDEEGNINKDPSSMLNVNAINARRQDKIDKFNVTAEVQKSTKALGDVVKVLNKDGVLTRDDVRGMELTVGGVPKQFEDAKNDIIDSLMTSPRNNASILYDTIGGYTFTEDADEAKGDPKMIYLKEDGLGLLQPQLTEEQTQAVRDKLDMEIEKQLGFKETSSATIDIRKQELAEKRRQFNLNRKDAKDKLGEEDLNLATTYSYAVDIASGSPDDRARAIRVLQSTNPSLIFKPLAGEAGYIVKNTEKGTEFTIKAGDKPSAYTDQIYGAIVGDKAEKGLASIDKARQSFLKLGGQISEGTVSETGTKAKPLPTTGLMGQAATSLTNEKGDYLSVSQGLNGDQLIEGKASDFNVFVDNIELEEGYEGFNFSDYVNFTQVGDEVKMTYKTTDPKQNAVVTFDPGEKKQISQLKTYFEEAFKNAKLIETRNRESLSPDSGQATEYQSTVDYSQFRQTD